MESWQTDRSDPYSPDRFYTAGERGGGALVQSRLPARLEHEVRALIESRRFPRIRTMSDFIRDAAYHRLHYLSSASPDTSDALRVIGAMQLLVDREFTLLTFRATVKSVTESVVAMLNEGDHAEAVKVFQDLTSAVAGMQNPHWQQKYASRLEELAEQYPILKTAVIA